MSDHIGVIESPRCARTRARLIEDPILRAMARELVDDLGAAGALELAGGDTGSIPFGFMNAALIEYGRRGGSRGGRIGGVAEAVVAIVRESAPVKDPGPVVEQPRCPDCRVFVTDHGSYFGVHLADCGSWEERCHRCHKLIPAGAASPLRLGLCRPCAETEPHSPGRRRPGGVVNVRALRPGRDPAGGGAARGLHRRCPGDPRRRDVARRVTAGRRRPRRPADSAGSPDPGRRPRARRWVHRRYPMNITASQVVGDCESCGREAAVRITYPDTAFALCLGCVPSELRPRAEALPGLRTWSTTSCSCSTRVHPAPAPGTTAGGL